MAEINESAYDSSCSKLDKNTCLNQEYLIYAFYNNVDQVYLGFIIYADLQRQEAVKECKWYFLIDLSHADENIKKCILEKISTRYADIYYRHGETINQHWSCESNRLPSFDANYPDGDIYMLSKLFEKDSLINKKYFLVSMDGNIDATKYGWPCRLTDI